MHITATELRNNIKKHLDRVSEGEMLIVTRGTDRFALVRKDLFKETAGGADKLLHSKLDSIIDSIESLAKKSPTTPPAETTTAQLREMPGASYGLVKSIQAEVAELEDQLVHCQDQGEADRLFKRMDELQKEKDRLLLEEARR